MTASPRRNLPKIRRKERRSRDLPAVPPSFVGQRRRNRKTRGSSITGNIVRVLRARVSTRWRAEERRERATAPRGPARAASHGSNWTCSIAEGAIEASDRRARSSRADRSRNLLRLRMGDGPRAPSAASNRRLNRLRWLLLRPPSASVVAPGGASTARPASPCRSCSGGTPAQPRRAGPVP